jgi:hypothetical protein
MQETLEKIIVFFNLDFPEKFKLEVECYKQRDQYTEECLELFEKYLSDTKVV